MLALLLLFGSFALAQMNDNGESSSTTPPSGDDQDASEGGGEEEEPMMMTGSPAPPPHPSFVKGRGEDLIPHRISIFEAKIHIENIGLRNDLYKRVPDEDPMNYHNGPVMSEPITIYPIFYGDWNKTGKNEETGKPYSDTSSGVETLLKFLRLYGNDTLSSRFSINSGYGAGLDFVKVIPKNFTTEQPYFIETYVLGSVISQKDIRSLVTLAINKNTVSTTNPSGGKWKETNGPDQNGIYLVMTASEIEDHSGFCSDYCGWHTYGSIGDVNEIKYIFVGNPANCLDNCAPQVARSPNKNPGVDAMINVIAHELDETVTDPLLSAWYDQNGEEGGDKCNWDWGYSVLMGFDGAYSNLRIEDPETGLMQKYLVQTQWKVDLGTSFIEQLGCANS